MNESASAVVRRSPQEEPLDLEPIKRRYLQAQEAAYALLTGANLGDAVEAMGFSQGDVPALLTEIERLRKLAATEQETAP